MREWITSLVLCAALAVSARSVLADDWPQLQHDAQHTGYTAEVLAAPNGLSGGWGVDFQALPEPQHIGRTVQVIAENPRVVQSAALSAQASSYGRTQQQINTTSPLAIKA